MVEVLDEMHEEWMIQNICTNKHTYNKYNIHTKIQIQVVVGHHTTSFQTVKAPVC